MKILHEQPDWKVTKSFISNSVITLQESFRPVIGFKNKPSGYREKFPLKYRDKNYTCTITSRESIERKYPWLEFRCEELNSLLGIGETIKIQFADNGEEKLFLFENANSQKPMKNIRIYNINSTPASKNMEQLYSPPHIYWDIKSFENEFPDCVIFFVWREGGKIIYTTLMENRIKTDYIEEQDITVFEDDGKDFKVEGKWGDFVKFKIKDIAPIKRNWDFTFKLGNQNPNYFLYKNGNKLNDIEKRIQKIADLKDLDFSNESTYENLEMIEKSYNVIPSKKKKPSTKSISSRQLIEHVHEYIANAGYQYHKEEIANFYLSLRSKPFVILAGISGTGKTQLPRKFAEALGFSEKQLRQIPVKPDWTDSSELIGFVSLDGKFIEKELTLAIKEASSAENQNKPYFFILDEMNLARVEHYFSDFLSVIETRKRNGSHIITDPILRKELLNNADNQTDFEELYWPQNLFLIGTVNMDETTHTFSRKVLDRANSIEMNEVDLNWIKTTGGKVNPLENVDYSYFKTPYLISIDLLEENKQSISTELEKLIEINKILQKADLHFAYRVRDEIAFYLVLNKIHELMDDQTAFDFQLVQKVLPRIHGSSERIYKVLIELLHFLELGQTESVRTDQDFEKIESMFPTELLKFKRASRKILFMLKRFDEDRFTSFWL
jgi:hypothetical protein